MGDVDGDGEPGGPEGEVFEVHDVGGVADGGGGEGAAEGVEGFGVELAVGEEQGECRVGKAIGLKHDTTGFLVCAGCAFWQGSAALIVEFGWAGRGCVGEQNHFDGNHGSDLEGDAEERLWWRHWCCLLFRR